MKCVRRHNRAATTKSIAIALTLSLAGCALAPGPRGPGRDAAANPTPSRYLLPHEIDAPMVDASSIPVVQDSVAAAPSQASVTPAPTTDAIVYNFGYSAQWPEATGVKHVFDDGNETYLEFAVRPSADADAFDARGNPLGATRYGDYLVIPGVHRGVLIQSRGFYSYVIAGAPEMRAATQLNSAPPLPGTKARLAAAIAAADEVRVRQVVLSVAHASAEHVAATLQRAARELELHETKLWGNRATLARVRFAAGATRVKLSEQARSALVRAAQQSKQVILRARTDAIGSEAVNAKVARARALSAKQMLISAGVAPEKIKLAYLAKGDYIAPNGTKAGRAQNRRLDIVFVGADQASIDVAFSDNVHAKLMRR